MAVFPTRDLEAPLSRAFGALEPAGLLRRIYREDLLKEGAVDRAGLAVRLLRLVVLDTAALPAAARALADAARTQADPLPRLDLIEAILVYQLRKLSRDEIKTMLHLPHTDLKQTRFYREVFAEGGEEGREEARRRIALNLVRQTELDDAAIAAATGLGIDEVRALRQSGGSA